VADGVNGLKVVNLSDPRQPTLQGQCDTSGIALGVKVVGDYAYVADGTADLQVIDVRDRAHPILRGTLGGTGGSAEGIDVVGRVKEQNNESEIDPTRQRFARWIHASGLGPVSRLAA
jgi:hypothetical protein